MGDHALQHVGSNNGRLAHRARHADDLTLKERDLLDGELCTQVTTSNHGLRGMGWGWEGVGVGVGLEEMWDGVGGVKKGCGRVCGEGLGGLLLLCGVLLDT